MSALLSVQDLTVSYSSAHRERLLALEGVSFEIASGETVGLLGESGCGKSTLALTILKLLPPLARVVRGSVMFCGTDLLALNRRQIQDVRGARVAIVHQEPALALNPVIRVGEQISEVLRAHGSISSGAARDEAISLLTRVGFNTHSRIWEAYPHQLSGGQRQRVAIAQAIACRPSLVIADEPTTALDPVSQLEILNLLESLREQLGLALILISHDPGMLAHSVDRLLIMYAGRVVEQGATKQVLNRPLHPYTQGLLQCLPAELGRRCRGSLEPIPGDPPDLAHLPAGCSFEARCRERMEICQTCRPNDFQPGQDRRVACFKYAG